MTCEICHAARRAFETLANEVQRASVPIPSERTTLRVLVDNAREKIEAALEGHDHGGYDAVAQIARRA